MMKKIMHICLLSACYSYMLCAVSKLIIQTNDSRQFSYKEAEIAALRKCKTIDNLLIDFDGHAIEIYLPIINARCWKRVLHFSKSFYNLREFLTCEPRLLLPIDDQLSALSIVDLHAFINSLDYLNHPSLIGLALDWWLIKHGIETSSVKKFQFTQSIKTTLQEKVIKYLTILSGLSRDERESIVPNNHPGVILIQAPTIDGLIVQHFVQNAEYYLGKLQDNHGYTFLHYASQLGCEKIVTLLLTKGHPSPINLITRDGIPCSLKKLCLQTLFKNWYRFEDQALKQSLGYISFHVPLDDDLLSFIAYQAPFEFLQSLLREWWFNPSKNKHMEEIFTDICLERQLYEIKNIAAKRTYRTKETARDLAAKGKHQAIVDLLDIVSKAQSSQKLGVLQKPISENIKNKLIIPSLTR